MNFPPHKCGLYLTHNEHRDHYKTVAEWEADPSPWQSEVEWVSPEQRQKAIDTNEMWRLQWYPETPIGSYTLRAADLDVLLAAANEVQ